MKVKFDLPEPVILNETIPFTMTESQYNKAVKETPEWKLWVHYLLPFTKHPYEKFKN